MKFTGRHELIAHDFRRGETKGGELDAVRATASGLTLDMRNETFAPNGCYTSGAVALERPANEMVMTWNAGAPAHAALLIEYRVRAAGAAWSVWYTVGMWKPEKRLKMFRDDPDYGPLAVDHLKATRAFDEVVYRIHFRSFEGAQTPVLRRVTLCVSDTAAAGEAGLERCAGGAVDLRVPWLSQHDAGTVTDDAMRKAGACAPTATTMVLRYYGIPAQVDEIGRRAFDPGAYIYGNWSYLMAASSEYGPDAWAQRFSGLAELERLIASGTPVIVSVSYKKGELSVKPERESAGHLMVVRGVTAEGDIIVNDPDAETAAGGDGVVWPRLEFARAFFGHGGVALIVKKITDLEFTAPR